MDKSETMTIGGLAKAAVVNVETIRYYQRRNLLHEPTKPMGGIRRYSLADLERLNFIKTAQKLGFKLDEIAELLKLEDGAHCHEASELAEAKLASVREKIDGLQRIKTVLADILERCHKQQGDINCPLIASLYSGIDKPGIQ